MNQQISPRQAEAAQPVLSLRHVSKIFGGVTALDDVAFEIMPGEVHCLAGENGCGKSTLIKIITGVYTPEPGAELRYFGQTLGAVTPKQARDMGIEVIWQDLSLFSEMTVAENIAFDAMVGVRPRLVSYRTMRQQARRVLDTLDIEIDLDVPLRQLPIAQRQIVAVARALVSDARLVFMDEPTASLTQTETDSLLGIVRKLSARGVAVVFVSHRLAEVLDVANRVTVLRDGRLVGVFDTDGMTQSHLTELMTGKTFDKDVNARDRRAAPPVVEVRGLGRKGEYHDINLTIRQGEILGLTGLIGAGRTELGLSLFGMTRPDRGEMALNGRPLRLRSNRDAVATGIGFVPEDRLALGLIQPQPIADNIVISVLNRISGRAGLISGARKSAMVGQWIAKLNIKTGRPRDPVSTLSGGNQQRVVLAKWLATEPAFLVLDSPTVGVDVGARAGIFEIVRALAAEGLAILLISDEVPEVYFNADRILHMAGGRIIREYDPRKVALRELEEAVYG